MSELTPESEEIIDDEIVSEDETFEIETRPSRLKGLITGRRALVAAALAVTLVGVTAFLTLRDKGPGGKALMRRYDKIAEIDDPSEKPTLSDKQKKKLQFYVLEQVAAGNMPDSYNNFVTVEAKGKNDTIVRFKVAPHGLRIGHNDDWIEVPLDGPFAAAAAEILGYSLPTPWMVEATYRQAIGENDEAKETKNKKKDKKKEDKEDEDDGDTEDEDKEEDEANGKVKFIAAREIAKELDIPWPADDEWMLSPQFIRKHNELLHDELEKDNIEDDQLISGYAKEICIPSLAENRKRGIRIFKAIFDPKDDPSELIRLEFMGGYLENGLPVQPSRSNPKVSAPSGGRHTGDYYDYSHIVRFVEPDELEVQEDGWDEPKTMSFSRFHDTKEYALEFDFDKPKVQTRPYPYYPELAKWMRDNGHLRSPLNQKSEKSKKKNK